MCRSDAIIHTTLQHLSIITIAQSVSFSFLALERKITHHTACFSANTIEPDQDKIGRTHSSTLDKHVNICKFLKRLCWTWDFRYTFALQEWILTLVIQRVNQEASVRSPVADLMKPEMGGPGRASLISIYLNELWHKLPHPLSAVKIKWDLQSTGLVRLMCFNYWQGPVRYH